MALVSVLIPAFKAEYLPQAVLSALQQTFTDIEVLVGDDTPDARLESVVAGIPDPRLIYYHHGYGDGELNLRQLWNVASGRYVKPLFDDDLLLPGSVEALVGALDDRPESALAFHERVYINADGQIIRTPPQLMEPGSVVELDRRAVVELMLPKLDNLFGEPTNTMLNRDLVDITQAYLYRGRKLEFLADVASYLNLSTDAPIIGVGGYLSGFRQHGSQNSNVNSPRISAGLYEWELFVRTEAAEGNLTGSALRSAWRALRLRYAPFVRQLPEIAQLSSHLDEIVQTNSAALLSPRFEADLDSAVLAVESRLRRARRHEVTASRCAICQQPVESWVPRTDNPGPTLADQIGAVGSLRNGRLCPACGSTEIERLLWLNMHASQLAASIPKLRILHIAPEPGLSSRIVALEPSDYVTYEITDDEDRRDLEITATQFDSDYFDLVICNHVLETVEFPQRLLSEMFRCLSDGGQLIAQTRYASILRETIETTTIDDLTFAAYFFGDATSVRLFGLDVIDQFHAVGFLGEPIPQTTMLGDSEAQEHGIDPREPFFMFRKPAASVTADLQSGAARHPDERNAIGIEVND